MLETKGLTKHYGATRALEGFDYAFDRGIYALLGPNGSGKSTLMNLLTDNLARTSGSITLDGREILALGKEYRAKLGFMPQYPGMYPNYSCEEFLFYVSCLDGIKKKNASPSVERLLKVVGLYEVRRSRIKTMSGGMKQRLALAAAFVNDPEIVILDEPTAGLDPRQRIEMRNFLSEEALGKTIIIATHVVSDVESIARDCIFLKKGVIAMHGSPNELSSSAEGKVWKLKVGDEEELKLIGEKYLTIAIKSLGTDIFVRLISDGCPGEGAVPEQPTLEDAYLSVFGKEAGTGM